MRTLRASINTAMRIDETIGGNPVAALSVPSTKRREVAARDLEAWWRDVEELTPVRRDLHIAMMMSGPRRSSLLQVRRRSEERLDGKEGVSQCRSGWSPCH